MSEPEERQKFEAWAGSRPQWCHASKWLFRQTHDDYEDVGVQIAWETWQARASQPVDPSPFLITEQGMHDAAKEIADYEDDAGYPVNPNCFAAIILKHSSPQKL